MTSQNLPVRFMVRQSNLSPAADDTYVPGRATRLGLPVITDFYVYMALAGKAYQINAGTISTPLVGDVVLTNSAAEMCIDAASGLTLIPVNLNVALRLTTGTLHEYAVKSVASASTGGAAFVPLPLLLGGSAATATARVAAAGGVAVAAELATTTMRHWAYSNPVAGGAGNETGELDWSPRTPPVIKGVGCLYVQIAATGTGPSYYASLDFIEAPTASLL